MIKKTLNQTAFVKNYYTNQFFSLEPLSNNNINIDKDVEEIVKICNESLIYNSLFKKKLSSKPYTKYDAQEFISWANKGWKENKHFTYVVRDKNRTITAAVDIKSNNLEKSEIGYWASNNHSGLMTNTVGKLIEIAKSAGYKSLYAIVDCDNDRSIKLLGRLQFTLQKKTNPKEMFFEKKLE